MSCYKEGEVKQKVEGSTHAVTKAVRKIELEEERKVLALIPTMQTRLLDEKNPFRVTRAGRKGIKKALMWLGEAGAVPGSVPDTLVAAQQAILDREAPELRRHLAWIAAKNLKLAPPGAKLIPDHPLFMVTPAGEVFSLIGGAMLKVNKDGDIALKDRIKVQLAKAVASCFLPNPLGRKRVEAIDGDICKANVNNLRWAEQVSRKPRKRRNSPAATARAKAARDLQRRREAALLSGASVAEVNAIR